ncbi:hypothetical protein LCGC14_0734300, partial [marine sediment metagenome]
MGNTRLLKALQRNGISQRRASQALDISQNLINRVVKHGATPGLRTAAKIVHGFDGEIKISTEGLPEGFTATAAPIPGDQSESVIF